MDLEFSNQLSGWVQKHKQHANKAVRNAVHSVLRRYRHEIERMPIAYHISINDKIRGIAQNARPLVVSFDDDGATIRIRPFYANARHPKVLEALRKTGGTYKLNREGLFVASKNDPSKKKWESFSQAPRLLQWAQEIGEHRRSAVLISDQKTLNEIWGELREKILDEINREISFQIF